MFDDTEEATGVSKEVHRNFFHHFITFGSTVLFSEYVVYPTNKEEAIHHMVEYTKIGVSGAYGSTDAVNIVMDRCYWRLQREYLRL